MVFWGCRHDESIMLPSLWRTGHELLQESLCRGRRFNSLFTVLDSARCRPIYGSTYIVCGSSIVTSRRGWFVVHFTVLDLGAWPRLFSGVCGRIRNPVDDRCPL